MSKQEAALAIGELGRRTGLATSALRYYERAGLLAPAGRAHGRRYYSPASAERIALIRLCQDAGFTLAEIRTFIAAGSRRHPSWTRLMEGKLLELDAFIARAKRYQARDAHRTHPTPLRSESLVALHRRAEFAILRCMATA